MSNIGERGRLLKLASYASVATAGLLIIIKSIAWLMTGSVSMLASLMDSVMDSLASLVNLVAIKYSLQPADAEHRFGHGKAEPLAGLAQAAFISGSAIFLILHAVDRLRFPHELEKIGIGIGVMLVAIVLTLILLGIQHSVIRKTQSTAIRADALHYTTDLLTNTSIILALLLTSWGFPWADPVFAMGVALYIFYSASRIAYEAFQQLMDRELPPGVEKEILDLARKNPLVKGVHDLRTRQSGQTRFVQLHLELDKDLPLYEAHALADEVDSAISTLLPDAEIIIHQDPVNLSAVTKSDT